MYVSMKTKAQGPTSLYNLALPAQFSPKFLVYKPCKDRTDGLIWGVGYGTPGPQVVSQGRLCDCLLSTASVPHLPAPFHPWDSTVQDLGALQLVSTVDCAHSYLHQNLSKFCSYIFTNVKRRGKHVAVNIVIILQAPVYKPGAIKKIPCESTV